MALVVKDRVRDSTTSTGTGTITLSNTPDTGYQAFSAIGDGNQTFYCIEGGSEWEVGIGTYTLSGHTLSRTTVLASSNAGSLVNFSVGTKRVFVTLPAAKVSGQLTTYEYAATAGQTTFTGADANAATLAYTPGAIIVTLNGLRLIPGDDFTATNGTSLVLTVGADAGDELLIDAFTVFDVANTPPIARTLTAGAGLTGGGDLSTNRTFAIDYTQAGAWTGKHTFNAQGNVLGSAAGNLGSPTNANTNLLLYNASSTNWAGIGAHTDGALYFATGTSSPSTRLVITPAGLVGIGVTSINYRLHVVETGNADVAQFIQQNAGFSSVVFRAPVTRTNDAAWWFFLASSNGYTDTEFNLRGDGNAFCDGSWSGGGADYAEYFEWADGNPLNEDRRGFSVVLVGDQIRKATSEDDPADILGVISGNPSVVGDAAWNMWKGKYQRDDFGTYLREAHTVTEWVEIETWTEQAPDPENEGEFVTVTRTKEVPHSYESDKIPEGVTPPEDATVRTHDDNGVLLTRRILNQDYDPNEEYTPREKRPEWSTVGLMGKLRLRKGQPTGDRWRKMRDVSETVEEWLVR